MRSSYRAGRSATPPLRSSTHLSSGTSSHGYCSAPAAQTKPNRWTQVLLMTTGKYSLHGFVWNNSSLLCAFPDARNYALGPPNPKGDLWFSLESTPQQCPRNQSDNIYIYMYIQKARRILSKKEEGNRVTRFQTDRKKPLIFAWLEIPAHRRHRGVFQTIA